jgi:hypothetical protein
MVGRAQLPPDKQRPLPAATLLGTVRESWPLIRLEPF